MAIVNFYSDTNLTTLLTSPMEFSQNIDGTSGDLDAVFYFGDPSSSVSIYAASNPGVDQITVSIADTTNSAGNGPQVLDVKLALTSGGLATAIAGASLDVGTSIAGGIAGKKSIHIRMHTPTTSVAGTFTELSISSNPTVKY